MVKYVVQVDGVPDSEFSDWSLARQRAIDLEECDGIQPDLITVEEAGADGE